MTRRPKRSAGGDGTKGARGGGASALRTSILVGIIYDWTTAALIFLRPPAVLRALGIGPPADPFHFGFGGLVLVVLPFFYLSAWRDPVRYSGVVAGMVAARLAGFVYLTVYGGAVHAPPVYLVFGVIDFLFAATHAFLARRAGLPGRG